MSGGVTTGEQNEAESLVPPHRRLRVTFALIVFIGGLAALHWVSLL
ncbi:hypothetical protein [Marinobacter sp.]